MLWSDDVRAGSFELIAYYLPFAVIAVGVARLNWSPRAVALLAVELVGLAVFFAGVGVYQYTTRNLFWNPKVIVSDAYEPFYRVNSVFWDPSIYGRFLMIAIIVALVAVVRGPSKKIALASAAALTVTWIGLVLSYSQSSFAGLIVAVVLLMGVVWRRAACSRPPSSCSCLISTGVANPNIQSAFVKRSSTALNKATSDRAGLIYNGIRIAIDNPVVGVGVGGFRHHYADLTGLKGKEPKKAASHDSPVTFAAEGGAIGLGLFAWVLVACFLSLARARGDSFTRRVVLAVGSLPRGDLGPLALLRPLLRGPDDLGAARDRRPGLGGGGQAAPRSRAAQRRRPPLLRARAEPGRGDAAHAQLDTAPGLGSSRAREPREHLEAAVERRVPGPRRAGRAGCSRARRGRGTRGPVTMPLGAPRSAEACPVESSICSGRTSTPTAHGSATEAASSTDSSPSTDWTTPPSSRPSIRLPWPTKRATSLLTGRV